MRIAVVALALLAAGCTLFPPVRDTSRFYTLSVGDGRAPEASDGRAPAARPPRPAADPLVALGPVTLPAYLDRNEVAVRVSATEIRYVPTERWAEPLEQNFARVLGEDLAAALASDRVVPSSGSVGLAPDYWIEVIVLRFEAGSDGSAQLTARWAVRDAARQVKRIRQSQHTRQATVATTEGGVQALSAALGDLAGEMAATLREVQAERRPD